MAKTYLTAKDKYPQSFDSVEGLTVYPYAIQATFQEIVVDRDVLVQGGASVALFFKTSVASNLKVKILGSDDQVEYYTLPISSFSSASTIEMKPHVLEVTSTADDQNFVFSVSIADLVRYVKIVVSGTGFVNGLKVSVR